MFVSILAVIAVITRVDQRAAFMSAFGQVISTISEVFAKYQYRVCHLFCDWPIAWGCIHREGQLEMVFLD